MDQQIPALERASGFGSLILRDTLTLTLTLTLM